MFAGVQNVANVAQVFFLVWCGCQLMKQQLSEPADRIERRADFVAHARDKRTLGRVGSFSSLFVAQCQLRLLDGGDVARHEQGLFLTHGHQPSFEMAQDAIVGAQVVLQALGLAAVSESLQGGLLKLSHVGRQFVADGVLPQLLHGANQQRVSFVPIHIVVVFVQNKPDVRQCFQHSAESGLAFSQLCLLAEQLLLGAAHGDLGLHLARHVTVGAAVAHEVTLTIEDR